MRGETAFDTLAPTANSLRKDSKPMAIATKTLQATLAPSTAHKERKLQETLSGYRKALHDAFDAGCETKNAVNEIVTPYDLSGYAKDALKNYVPGLVDDADELADDHPVRFTERGFSLDHKPENAIEWYVKIPHHEDYHLWLPARINPAQSELWHALLDERADVGQFRLQQHRASWELHVTVDYEVQEPDYEPTDDDVTPVGFDIGEAHLLAGCACEHGSPTDPLLVNGGHARQLRKEMFTTLKRLQERDAAQWRIDERFDHYQNALTDIIEKVSRQAVEYAHRFKKPVVVLEDLSDIREDLDYGEWMNRRLHAWAFARLQGRIEHKARAAGIPIKYAHPEYTSRTCHACQHVGYRNGDEFRCQNDGCWVSEYHADINAAVNIADRLDPWGESLPVKAADDDIPRDGSACDSATTHSEQSSPQQMTLGDFESKPTASD